MTDLEYLPDYLFVSYGYGVWNCQISKHVFLYCAEKPGSSRPEVFSLIKRLCHRCFPVNFAKFLRTPFFTEHFWWLLLKTLCFICSEGGHLSANCWKFKDYNWSKQVTPAVTFAEELQNTNTKLTNLIAKAFYFKLRLPNYRISIQMKQLT